jgi:hypothetical protein
VYGGVKEGEEDGRGGKVVAEELEEVGEST